MYMYLCDHCKRTFEHLYKQMKNISERPILFHGAYMDGSNCTRPDSQERNQCIQHVILFLAENEKPAGTVPTGLKGDDENC